MASSSSQPPPPTDTETTPLLPRSAAPATPLADPDAALESQVPLLDPSSPAALRAELSRGTWLASWILLSSSGITVVLDLALFILYALRPVEFWNPDDLWITLTAAAFFSGFLAVINLQRIRAAKPPGILFNIILHLLFFYLAAASVFGLSHRGSFGIDYPSCRSKDEHCLDFKWKWVLLSNTALAGGIIFAYLVHPILLLFWFLKARIAYGSPNRREWVVPAGVLTFEFSIKFLRQAPDGSVSPAAAAEAQASSSSS
ncbi:hypothetical protein jhhlp_005553 [Lomentospora prolificans]|uniref:Uncharacterized protein n=1 Tax=Lomentospora prolificans TaxID=41688 RepID=A0A2N3N3F7_9PEZI|nr:hypothetical protein jhhlp_005553 [Lomentospora prolificans]